MNEAYVKLFKLNFSQQHDTEWCRNKNVFGICSKNAPEWEDMQETYQEADNLYGPEREKQAYRKFCKYGLSPR